MHLIGLEKDAIAAAMSPLDWLRPRLTGSKIYMMVVTFQMPQPNAALHPY